MLRRWLNSGLMSPLRVSNSMLSSSLPPGHSTNSTMFSLLIITWEQWRMLVVLSIPNPTFKGKKSSQREESKMSSSLCYMRFLICGSVTSLPWSGGMIFGSMSLLLTTYHMCAWTKQRDLNNTIYRGHCFWLRISGVWAKIRKRLPILYHPTFHILKLHKISSTVSPMVKVLVS